MKGLLLKDIYQLKNYMRVFLVLVLFCVIIGFSGKDAIFMMYYPAVLMGMMPITLFAYDEKEKFFSLLSTLPIKKRTYVMAKYVMGILLVLLACVATGAMQGYKMIQADSFVFFDFLLVMALALAIGLIAPAIVLPLIFLLGVEKGRFVNIIVIAIALACTNIFMKLESDFQVIVDAQKVVYIIIGAAVLIYGVSCWITSIIFEKKEY